MLLHGAKDVQDGLSHGGWEVIIKDSPKGFEVTIQNRIHYSCHVLVCLGELSDLWVVGRKALPLRQSAIEQQYWVRALGTGVWHRSDSSEPGRMKFHSVEDGPLGFMMRMRMTSSAE